MNLDHLAIYFSHCFPSKSCLTSLSYDLFFHLCHLGLVATQKQNTREEALRFGNFSLAR